jgi:hypothetical protein
MSSQVRTHLILVCCHATYRGGNPDEEASWVLQDFQKSNAETGKVGEHHTFMQHIAAGATILAQDPDSLLMFSGGKTQTQIDLSEAESYLRVGLVKKFCRNEQSLRCAIETQATDSYQNLLFSIIQFWRLTRSYPKKITVITHAFKERRFLELHGPAIKYPTGALRVFGINPPTTLAELHDVQHGEMSRGYSVFFEDLYGVKDPLHSKRIARGWCPDNTKTMAYDFFESEVKQLLDWTGGASGNDVFPEKLPWEHC